MSEATPYTVQNRGIKYFTFVIVCLVNGQWKDSKTHTSIVDPLNSGTFLKVPNTDVKSCYGSILLQYLIDWRRNQWIYPKS